MAEIARISDEMAKNFGEKGEEKRKEEEERERKESGEGNLIILIRILVVEGGRCDLRI